MRRIIFLSFSVFFLLISAQTLLGQSVGDSAYTIIGSPTQGAVYTAPASIPVSAEVRSPVETPYFEIESPDNSFRTFKLGYDPTSIYNNPQNVSAGGNTHMEVTLKAISSSVAWEDIGIKFDSIRNDFDTYIPSGTQDTNWFTISIPLTDYPGDDFTDVSHLKLISNSAAAFTIGIKEIRFTGGTTAFLWFGSTKIDNSHTGTTGGGTPPSGEMNADLLEDNDMGESAVVRVKFYANGQYIGTDTQLPYAITFNSVLAGQYTFSAVTEMVDTSAHVSNYVTATVNGDSSSADIEITSPDDSTTFDGLASLTVNATVNSLANAYYLEVSSPDSSQRNLKLGYDPSSIFAGSNDVTANGNTHVEIIIKAMTPVEWDRIGLKMDNTRVDFDAYLPTGGIGSYWTVISIPLSAWSAADLTALSNIQIPFSTSAQPFTLGIKEIRFTGGTSDFIWFGGSKIDNSHNGTAPPTSPPSGKLNVELKTGSTVSAVNFYMNGVWFGVDSTSPYSVVNDTLIHGTHQLSAAALYDDSTSAVSAPVTIFVDALGDSRGFALSTRALIGDGGSRTSTHLIRDSLSGNYVMVWQEETSSNGNDIFMIVMDSSYLPLAPPSGYSSWPVQVNVQALNQALEQVEPVVSIDPQNSNIAIGWVGYDLSDGAYGSWLRVFDDTGAPLSAYSGSELMLGGGRSGEDVSKVEIAYGATNELYYSYDRLSGSAAGDTLWLNRINTSTTQTLLSSDASLVSGTSVELGNLSWSAGNGLLLSYITSPDTTGQAILQTYASDLTLGSSYALSSGTMEVSSLSTYINTLNDRILATWIESEDDTGNETYPIGLAGVYTLGSSLDTLITPQVVHISAEGQRSSTISGTYPAGTHEVAIVFTEVPESTETFAVYRSGFTISEGLSTTFIEDELNQTTVYADSFQSNATYFPEAEISFNPISGNYQVTFDYPGGAEGSEGVGDGDGATVELPGGAGAGCSSSSLVVNAKPVPSSNQNYILTETPLVPTSSEFVVSLLGISLKQTNINYIDGLGRESQSISANSAPDGRDLIAFTQYDAFGRVTKQHLPYVGGLSATGTYRTSAETEQAAYYSQSNFPYIPQADLNVPYAESSIEASPLNRILEQGAPGADWQLGQHTVSSAYLTNSGSLGIDNVQKWVYHPAEDSFTTPSVYSWDELMVQETTDENGHRVLSYTDKLGRQVLKRVEVDATTVNSNPNTWANTYFLYDDLGNLRHVIQPEGVVALNSASNNLYAGTILDDFVFSYEYDKRRRVIQKQVPGADPVALLYNKRDQVVLTQDGKQATNDEWSYTKYDDLGRPIETGLLSDTSSLSTLQTAIDNAALYETPENNATYHHYSNNAYPTASSRTIHSITYYDNYNFDRAGGDDYSYSQDANLPIQTPFLRTRGRVTGVKTRVLNGNSTTTRPDWLMTVTFYDVYGREIQTQTENHLGGDDVISNVYDFAGNMLTSRQVHDDGTDDVAVLKDYDYDHRGRLLSITQQTALNGTAGAEIMTVKQEYDGLGQMITKKLHGTDHCSPFLQTVDYKYNIRGWLTDINSIDDSCSVSGDITDPAPITDLRVRVSSPEPDYQRMYLTWTTTGDDGTSGSPAYYRVFWQFEQITEENVDSLGKGTGYGYGDLYTSSYETAGRLRSVSIIGFKYYPVGTKYYFAIQAVDDEGNASLSNVVRLTLGTEREGTTISTPSLETPIQPGSDLFRMKLYYNETFAEQNIHANADPQYNGNISGMVWQNILDCKEQGYGFAYDKMNRLTDAWHEVKGTTSGWSLNDDRYSVNGIDYDKNGNILALDRMGLTGTDPSVSTSYNLMDDLAYVYSGNRLTKVTDAITTTIPTGVDHFSDGANLTTEYQYDNSGNITTDENKGIDIAYNHLNKPYEITFTSGTHINKKIRYIYDATGTKLSQEVVDATNTVTQTTDYINGFHYEDGSLEFFNMEEGRVRYDGSDWVYEYQLKDHLGNVRVTFGDLNGDGVVDPNSEVQDVNDYYPFGARMAGENSLAATPPNSYLYNGKELQDELGLNWYDYGARMYDPAIGRWNGVDVQTERYFSISPFVYVANNPIILIDPNGEEIWVTLEDGSQVQYRDGKLWTNYENEEVYEAEDGSFESDFLESVTYLIENGVGEDIIDLSNDSEFSVSVVETKKRGGDYYDIDTQTIHWNSNFGVATIDRNAPKDKRRGIQSPAMGLFHEFGHPIQHRDVIKNGQDPNKEDFLNPVNQKFFDEDYEEALVKDEETPAARKINENLQKKNPNAALEGIRSGYYHHKGPIRTISPTLPIKGKREKN